MLVTLSLSWVNESSNEESPQLFRRFFSPFRQPLESMASLDLDFNDSFYLGFS